MKWGFTIVFICFYSLVFAQVGARASVDKNNIVIGETIELILEAYVPLGEAVTWFPVDTFPSFEIISKSRIDTSENLDGKRFVQRLVLTSFDSGYQSISALPLKVGRQTFFSDTVGITVSFVPYPPEDYRDIKNIQNIAHPWVKYVPIIIGALAVVCFVLIIFLLRVTRPLSTLVKKPAVILSPYDMAMQRIQLLKKAGLPQNGKTKVFYTELNDILREFVTSRLNIQTLDKTNNEIIAQLKRHSKDGLLSSLSKTLQISDMVKFARYQPTFTDHEENLHVVESSIKSLNSLPGHDL